MNKARVRIFANNFSRLFDVVVKKLSNQGSRYEETNGHQSQQQLKIIKLRKYHKEYKDKTR
ncbi:hypothetical protein [Dapis sp. BLCC M126]|uniref:hypothetical protein n=1 Tax=Dapis sp. BLCC M126 TaxID=3400189 RepID=UPI003CED8E31